MKANFWSERDGTFHRYEFTLTRAERREMWWAYARALLLGGAPADHMSPELEDLLCGYRPERYRRLS